MSVKNSLYLKEIVKGLSIRKDIEIISYQTTMGHHYLEFIIKNNKYKFSLNTNPLMDQCYSKKKVYDDSNHNMELFSPVFFEQMIINKQDVEKDIKQFLKQIKKLNYTERG